MGITYKNYSRYQTLGSFYSPATPAFVPDQISGLQHWFHVHPDYCYTDAAMTIHAGENDPVQNWVYKSSTIAVRFTQATLQARPLLKQISGRWVLRFDGIDDKMTHVGTWAPPSGTGMTAMIVYHPAITASIQRPLARWGVIAPAWNLIVSTTNLQFYGWTAGTGSTPTVSATKGANMRLLHLGGFGAGVNKVSKTRNAVVNSSATVLPNTSQTEVVTISNTDDGVSPFSGDVEAVIFTTLPPNISERDKVCNYYGLS